MTDPRFFKRVGRIHFVGIGGIGMSGIAEVLLDLGHEVSGSDAACSAATERLASRGARITLGHSASVVEGAGVVVTSSAIREGNPEVVRARELKIPVLPRAKMLAELMRLKHGIAVAGSHGKTTTTSLIAQVVAEAGLDPTVVVGGRVAALGSNARLGRGEILVCEADESDGSFLHLTPTLAVVTNIDAEHLEAFGGSLERLAAAFRDFCNAVPFHGAAIVCLDDAGVQGMLPGVERRVVTYGLTAEADVSLADLRVSEAETRFVATAAGRELGEVVVHQPGRHVALNALAAVAVGEELSLPFGRVRDGLAAFRGVDRRMSLRGEAAGVRVVDDYAHHPTEIVATLSALREASPSRRIIAIFQPHRYSRVAALRDAFCRAFSHADVVLACDLYAAGEDPLPGVTGEALAAGIRDCGHPAVEHCGTPAEAAARAAGMARPGDVVVTLGAGDVGRAAEALLARLRGAGPSAAGRREAS